MRRRPGRGRTIMLAMKNSGTKLGVNNAFGTKDGEFCVVRERQKAS